jgi:hypothetical protein
VFQVVVLSDLQQSDGDSQRLCSGYWWWWWLRQQWWLRRLHHQPSLPLRIVPEVHTQQHQLLFVIGGNMPLFNFFKKSDGSLFETKNSCVKNLVKQKLVFVS